MSDATDAVPPPWRHVRLPIPPGHPADGPPPLAKVWLPPVPAGADPCLGAESSTDQERQRS